MANNFCVVLLNYYFLTFIVNDPEYCEYSGEIRYDANGNPEPLPTAEERAQSLFSALDKDNDGCLTKQEFLTGYTKR